MMVILPFAVTLFCLSIWVQFRINRASRILDSAMAEIYQKCQDRIKITGDSNLELITTGKTNTTALTWEITELRNKLSHEAVMWAIDYAFMLVWLPVPMRRVERTIREHLKQAAA